MERLNRDWESVAPVMLSYDRSKRHAAQEIKGYYFGGAPDIHPENAMENFTKLFSGVYLHFNLFQLIVLPQIVFRSELFPRDAQGGYHPCKVRTCLPLLPFLFWGNQPF